MMRSQSSSGWLIPGVEFGMLVVWIGERVVIIECMEPSGIYWLQWFADVFIVATIRTGNCGHLAETDVVIFFDGRFFRWAAPIVLIFFFIGRCPML